MCVHERCKGCVEGRGKRSGRREYEREKRRVNSRVIVELGGLYHNISRVGVHHRIMIQ